MDMMVNEAIGSLGYDLADDSWVCGNDCSLCLRLNPCEEEIELCTGDSTSFRLVSGAAPPIDRVGEGLYGDGPGSGWAYIDMGIV